VILPEQKIHVYEVRPRKGAAFHQRSVLIQIRTPPFFPRFAWVITAVGMVDEIPVMIVAVVVAVAVMMIFSGI
jgi:hypothetical protein